VFLLVTAGQSTG